MLSKVWNVYFGKCPLIFSSTENNYIGKVLEKSNISGFIVHGIALTFFIRCGVKFLEELLDQMLLLC